MPPIQVKAFTLTGNNLLRELRTDVEITHPFDPKVHGLPSTPLKTYSGVWDTGATTTSISRRVVDDFKLPILGQVKLHTANKVIDTTTHLIAMRLPNGVGLPQLLAICADLSKGIDVLIGMDVINKGDFSITNVGGKTLFSFRMPSVKTIDYVAKVHSGRLTPKAGRNAPCPCGSGKKHKYCCGRAA